MGPLSLATSLSCRPLALSRTSSTIILITPIYPINPKLWAWTHVGAGGGGGEEGEEERRKRKGCSQSGKAVIAIQDHCMYNSVRCLMRARAGARWGFADQKMTCGGGGGAVEGAPRHVLEHTELRKM